MASLILCTGRTVFFISFTCAFCSYKNDSGRMLQRLVFSPVKPKWQRDLITGGNYHREGAICNRITAFPLASLVSPENRPVISLVVLL